MNGDNKSPEAYFNALTSAIEKAANTFNHFNNRIAEGMKVKNTLDAAAFVDSYCKDLNGSLDYVLTTIGLPNDNYYRQYEYDTVEYKILDLPLVLKELLNNRDLYISRIKVETTFVPLETLNAWASSFNKMLEDAEQVSQNFAATGL